MICGHLKCPIKSDFNHTVGFQTMSVLITNRILKEKLEGSPLLLLISSTMLIIAASVSNGHNFQTVVSSRQTNFKRDFANFGKMQKKNVMSISGDLPRIW